MAFRTAISKHTLRLFRNAVFVLAIIGILPSLEQQVHSADVQIAQELPWKTIVAPYGAWAIQFPGEPHVQKAQAAPQLTLYGMGNDDITLYFKVIRPSPLSSRQGAQVAVDHLTSSGMGTDISVSKINYNGASAYQFDYTANISRVRCLARDRHFASSRGGVPFIMSAGYAICNQSIKGQLLPIGEKFLNSLRF